MIDDLKIRFAKREDLATLVDIYNQAIRSQEATGDMDEFTVKERESWFEKHQQDSFPLYVVEVQNKVVGYCTISPYRPGRRAMESVAEVSYYLDYNFLGRGLGTQLLQHAMGDCSRLKIKSLMAILLDINIQSIALLEKLQFNKWGHFPNIIQLDQKVCGQLIYGLNL